MAEHRRSARRDGDGDGAASLLDRLSPLIADVLATVERLRAGTPPGPAIDVYKSLFGRLRQVRDDAVAAGRADAEVYEALFPAAAWIDERLAAFPDWRGDTAPLTVTLFKTAEAGPAFFERLRRLPDDRREVREVFLTCLALGYAGHVPPDRRGDLDRLIAEQRRKLGRLVSPAATVERPICPELYEVADPPDPRPAPRSAPRSALAAGAAALLLFAAGVAALAWPRPGASEAGPAAPGRAGEVEDSGPIALLLESLDCARVRATRTDGTVVLSGHVASATDRDRLLRSLRALDSVETVSSTLQVVEWPFCEMVGLVADRAGGVGAPAIAVNREDRRYRPGENLVVEVTAATGFDGYLYVDYVDAGGEVLHLLPEPLRPDNIVHAGETVTVGSEAILPRPNERQWAVARPLGRKMIVAIAAPIPLFEDFRPVEESVAGYLPDLAERLAALEAVLDGEGVSAAYLFVEAIEAEAEGEGAG
jgi:type IV/VI secretion system ImpK/VasF family protein